jgi:hypothetical protein
MGLNKEQDYMLRRRVEVKGNGSVDGWVGFMA